jgi:hypothetical protein
MGRAKSETVEYFYHSCNHGYSLRIVEKDYDCRGYSCWFKLLELLGRTPGHKLVMENEAKKLMLLWAESKLSNEEGRSVFELFAEIGMIDKDLYDLGIIWSQNFIDKISHVYKKRQTSPPQKPAIGDGNVILDTGKEISTYAGTRSKGREVKEVEERIYSVFDFWNKQGIIQHRSLTQKFESKIKARLNDGYSLNEIMEAVCNYAFVIECDDFYWTHKWSLDKFMIPENLDRFLTEANPFMTYLKDSGPKYPERDNTGGWGK